MLDKFLALIRNVVDCLQTYNGAVTAIATIFVGIFTFVLAMVTGRQARLTTEALNVARAELISTHRPRIIMRRVFLRPLEIGRPPCVQYDLANIGGSTARIVQFDYSIWVTGEKLTDVSGQFERAESQEDQHTLRAGEALQSNVKGKSDLTPDDIKTINRSTGKAGGAGVIFLGVLAYLDENGIKRRTAFRRHYDPSRDPSFSIYEDPDYEYVD